MGFQQALSGLNAASRNLDVIGNNVANANTVGFKTSQAQFADLFAASLSGASSNTAGIGTRLAAVAQQFTQGAVTVSSNPLDMAINGSGFFRLSDNGTIKYSRNGQFQLDKDGYIINSANMQLTGYPIDATGALDTASPQPLRLSTSDLAPVATTQMAGVLNLDSRAPIIGAAFDPTNSATFTNSTSLSVYDSLGNAHSMSLYFVKTAASTWNVYGTLDGATGPVTPSPLGTLTFTSTGAIDTTATTLPFAASLAFTNGATTPQAVNVDFTGTTQFGSGFSVNALTQDGYTSGKLSGFSISSDGTILGRYTNGRTSTLGQVVMANFTNPNGLVPMGGNTWAESADSGTPLIGEPSSGNLGALQSGAVEDSNVDLTAELVNMITAQRVYQANAQTIKTQDAVLQTLVNLR
ncbi:MAG: flagellar hook protein FlgE [Betaproteobacteria bacterium]|nr:flagellar hook protein FlgE [Betaproteobacteria bacterium]